jgi:hypothetical protein
MKDKAQKQRFIDKVRELGCDEAAFEARLRRRGQKKRRRSPGGEHGAF